MKIRKIGANLETAFVFHSDTNMSCFKNDLKNAH